MGHHSIFPCAVKLGKTPRAVAREDSDVDLLVVEAEPFGAERTRLGEMSRHIIAHSLREGRILYERP